MRTRVRILRDGVKDRRFRRDSRLSSLEENFQDGRPGRRNEAWTMSGIEKPLARLEACLISKLYTLLRLLKAPVEEKFQGPSFSSENKNEIARVTCSGNVSSVFCFP